MCGSRRGYFRRRARPIPACLADYDGLSAPCRVVGVVLGALPESVPGEGRRSRGQHDGSGHHSRAVPYDGRHGLDRRTFRRARRFARKRPIRPRRSPILSERPQRSGALLPHGTHGRRFARAASPGRAGRLRPRPARYERKRLPVRAAFCVSQRGETIS